VCEKYFAVVRINRSTNELESGNRKNARTDTNMSGGKKIGKKTIYFADDAGSDGPKSIGEFYDLSLEGGGRDGIKYFSYAKPSDEEVKRILEETGVDVSDTTRFISDQRIIHARNRHSEENEEIRGQEPITREDFEKIPEYIRTADKISIVGKTDQGLDVIRYQKRVNGYIVVLEEHRKRKKILDFSTMWKYKT